LRPPTELSFSQAAVTRIYAWVVTAGGSL